MTVPTNAEQVACLKREIALRKSVYPKFIQSGRMTQHEADRQIELMTAALHSLIGQSLPEEATPAMLAAGGAFLDGVFGCVGLPPIAMGGLWRAMRAAWIASR